jgi:formate dehydrogenase subunit delta
LTFYDRLKLQSKLFKAHAAMEPKKMVGMANQIAKNWDYGPDKSKAIAGVVDHLRRFWSPLMLDEITEFVSTGEAELSTIAKQALAQLIEERQAAE